MNKFEAVQAIQRAANGTPVITSLGTTTRFFMYASKQDKPASTHFPLLSTMGGTLSVATGVAIGLPATQRAWVVLGDGDLLMGAHALFTLAELEVMNLDVLLLNNGVNAQTSGFSTALGAVSIGPVAKSLGFQYEKVSNASQLAKRLARLSKPYAGVRFLEIAIDENGLTETEADKPDIDAPASLRAFQTALATLR